MNLFSPVLPGVIIKSVMTLSFEKETKSNKISRRLAERLARKIMKRRIMKD